MSTSQPQRAPASTTIVPAASPSSSVRSTTAANTPPAAWTQHPRAATPTSTYSNTHLPRTTPGSPASTVFSPPSSPSSTPSPSPVSPSSTTGTSTPTPPTHTGQSPKTPVSGRSKWGIGWETPVLMVVCYILALATALLHLFLFRYISGKRADGKDRVAPQSYISTSSNILANGFAFFLNSALTVAFVQHLWRLLRIQSMKVSTIESLFEMKSNPFKILTSAALRAAPTLCIVSIIVSGMTVAVSFPPGAITVVSTQRASYSTVPVPTFNASFMGNASGTDANAYSIMPLSPDSPSGFVAGDFDEAKDGNLIIRLARQVLITGEAFTQATPCASNCSYTIQYEGPWIECTNSTSTYFSNTSDSYPIYSGTWTATISAFLSRSLYNGTYTQAHYNSSTLTPIKAQGPGMIGDLSQEETNALVQDDRLMCQPGRALFTVNNTWTNNIQTRTFDVAPISPLINLALQTHDSVVIVPGFCAETGYGYGTKAANWSQSALDWYRDNNMMAIFAAMLSFLDGQYTGELATTNSSITHNDSTTWYTDLAWKELIGETTNFLAVSTGENGTLIDSTRFNAAFEDYSPFASSYPSFHMTQDMLNDYLFNLTSSMMLAYGNWNTTSNATIIDTINVYSFSSPLSLILPYFISLAASLPFIILGFLSLIRNGVAAIDGGFIQLASTTTGSKTLEDAAAGGCLGGAESVEKSFKELEVRFGELAAWNTIGGMRRAGFGVTSEIKDLEKGQEYGIQRLVV